MKLAAIVTAAGASTRMGDAHKALLDWGGVPLVAHQVECLTAAGFDPIVVVTGAEGDLVADAVPEEGTVVHNKEWESGRSRSIAEGADALPDGVDAILVVAVDQPLGSDVLHRLVEHAGAPLVQPADDDGAGHPVILGGEYLNALRRIEQEEQGLRSVVDRARPDGLMITFDSLPHWDLNTPETYRSSRASFERTDSE
jgi:CTP:molybdopterin cytidylyltransferase MocA